MWKVLGAGEKKPFEAQYNQANEKYKSDLAKYKKDKEHMEGQLGEQTESEDDSVSEQQIDMSLPAVISEENENENEKPLLQNVSFLLDGKFHENASRDHSNVEAMIQSFQGKVLTRWSKNVGKLLMPVSVFSFCLLIPNSLCKIDFLLVGEGPSKERINQACKREVAVITWPLLQRFLCGNIASLDCLRQVAKLSTS